jgi:hypothetical protein
MNKTIIFHVRTAVDIPADEADAILKYVNESSGQTKKKETKP